MRHDVFSRPSDDQRIVGLDAWQALDSRGTPTVAVEVTVGSGHRGVGLAPAGASTGSHEAHELRDHDASYDGRSVHRAVNHVRDTLAPLLLGRDATEQAALDETLREADGTPELGRLGANAIVATSIALAHAGAGMKPLYRHLAAGLREENIVLPRPMFNIVSGGAHAGGITPIQDVLAIPLAATSMAEATETAWRVRRSATELLRSYPGTFADLVADEGGLAAPSDSSRAAVHLVAAAIDAAGYTPGKEVGLALDVAATEFATPEGTYRLHPGGEALTGQELIDTLTGWVGQFGIVSLEDPLAEDDWDGWQRVTRTLGATTQLVGDDLFVTHPARLRRGIQNTIGNAILVKANQIGTLSDAISVITQAHQAGYHTIVSARSGDTEQHWPADLALAAGASQIKIGSLTRSERTAKWNRLLHLEHQLAPAAQLCPWVRPLADTPAPAPSPTLGAGTREEPGRP
jgi:enolase